MADSCCGEEWLGFEDDFVIKLLSKYVQIGLLLSDLNLSIVIQGQGKGQR